MTQAHPWTRRGAAAGMLAALGGCATRRQEPVLSINVAQLQPQPGTPPQTGTRLETAFDEALRMTVPVHLGRRGPFQFVVDTGANRTVVSRETAQLCGMPPAGSTPVHGIAGAQPATLVKAPRLRVGQVFSSNLTLPALPRASLGADGLLGVDVLRGRRIRLDFRGNTFEISASGQGAVIGRGTDTRIRDRNERVRVQAHYRAGQLVIFDAEVAGTPVRAFLDSGSQVTVGNEPLRQMLLKERPDLARYMKPTELISATGQTAPATLAELPRLRLGGVAINDLRAAFASLHIFDLWDLADRPAILVGVDVLRHFDEVTLDFARREVIFLRRPGYRAPPAPPRL